MPRSWRRTLDQQDYRQLSPAGRRARLKEIAPVFLRLGAVAFGGPAAHIALMEEEIVRKRAWLSREAFLDLLGATNLIPGPNSTEMAIHLGFSRGGLAGLVTAGVAFILPAFFIVLIFAALYARHGQVSGAEAVLYGIKPVVLAVILQALLRLSKSVVKSPLPALVTSSAIALSFLGVPEIPLLAGSGLLVMLLRNRERIKNKLFSVPLFPIFGLIRLPALAETSAGLPISSLFFTFLKIGSALYGSGYVLLAFLEAEFVSRLGVLTGGQLMDAVAVGQFTPGPVFTTATFVGFLLGGIPGALASTAGIFLPSFLLVFLLNPLIPRMRASVWFSALLDGVTAASLALMAAVSARLALASLPDVPAALFLAVSFIALMKTRISSFWLILLGGLAGFLIRAFL